MNIRLKIQRYKIWLKIKRYKKMLLKYAKDPSHLSFYCCPSDEDNIPVSSGEYLEWIRFCPQCRQIMEKHNIAHGCGHIEAFYCKKDNLHWIFDVYGIAPPAKWYGPFPGYPDWVVSYFRIKEIYLPLISKSFDNSNSNIDVGEQND